MKMKKTGRRFFLISQSLHLSISALTLVELMLVMSLFSAIMATVTGLVQQGLRLSQQLDGTKMLTQTHELALKQVTDDVAHAARLYQVPFVGGANHVEFARIDPALRQWLHVVYRLDGERLMREASAITPDGAGPIESRVLLPHVESISFDFGWRHPTTKSIVWHTPWPEVDEHPVPQFVRVRLSVPGPNGSPMQVARTARNFAGAVPEEESP